MTDACHSNLQQQDQFKCNCTLVNAQSLPYINNRPEIWSCAYSPYMDLFAWSNTDGIVYVVDFASSPDLKLMRNKSRNGEYLIENENEIRAYIDCGEPVWSLAFGSAKTQVKNQRTHHKRPKRENTRFKLDDYLILAVGLESGKIRIYNAITRAFLFVLRDHKDVVRDLKFTKNGTFQLASVSRDETVKLWDMFDDGNMYKTLDEHTGWVYSCDWSPTASLLCTVGDNRQVFLWDTQTYKRKFSLRSHHNKVVSCEFSPDGALLATGSYDTKICIWNPYTGELMKQFYHLLPPPRAIYAGGTNDAYIRSIKFSPNGDNLVSLCDDKKIRVWSLENRRQTTICESTHTDGISCTYSSDGELVLVGTRNGRVDLYKTPVRVQKLTHICRKLVNQLVERKNLEKLHLPRDLVSFLCYEDIQNVRLQTPPQQVQQRQQSMTSTILHITNNNKSSSSTTNQQQQQQQETQNNRNTYKISINLKC